MKPTMQVVPMFLLFFYAIQPLQAVPNSPIAKVAALQSALTFARYANTCPTSRTKKIVQVKFAISATRDCLYRGLPYEEYAAKRAICMNRSEARAALSKCRQTSKTSIDCAMEAADLATAVVACMMIGWDGTDKNCPSLSQLQAELTQAEAIVCPTPRPGEGPGALKDRLEEAVEHARKSLGLPSSAYETRTFEPGSMVPDAVVIMLHGIGSTGISQLTFARKIFERTGLQNIRFLMPTAKPQLISLLNFVAPAWFDVLSNSAGGPEAKVEIVNAAKNIDNIAEIQRRVFGIAPERVLVFGVSQGGELAQTMYMRHRVGGAISLAGRLPIAESYPKESTRGSIGAESLIFHGREDQVVPVDLVRRGVMAMRSAGRKVTYVEVDGEDHDLAFGNGKVLSQVAAFVQKVLR